MARISRGVTVRLDGREVAASPAQPLRRQSAQRKGTRGYRFVDAWDDSTRLAREVKMGFADLSPFIQRQIDKDVLLRTRGTVTDVEWHFVLSDTSGTIGPSTRLLNELRQRGIPYFLHPPA